jgi:phytanoyl-CoA hydroxylase
MLNLKSKLDKDGYVILDNFFNKVEITQLKRNAKEIFQIQFNALGYDTFSGYNEEEVFKQNMIRLFNEHEEIFKNCGKLIQTGLINLYHIGFSNKLISTLKFDLGLEYPNMCTRPVLYFNHPRLAKEEVYYKSPLHQDWPSIESSLNSLVVWVPLLDVDMENGSLILFPGSHKNGVLPF